MKRMSKGPSLYRHIEGTGRQYQINIQKAYNRMPPTAILRSNEAPPRTNGTVQVSVRGKWITVPAVEVCGNTVVVIGTWLRMASVESDEYLAKELDSPQNCIDQLKRGRRTRPRIDIFTFTPRAGDLESVAKYHTEWDSMAVVRTDNFNEWWASLPQETRKNVRRAEKRGVLATVTNTVDNSLINGIVGVNNDSPVRQGKEFVHYGKTFDEVKRDQAAFADCSEYICAYLGEELIGFIKIVFSGPTASIVQILPKASHSDKRPANAMLAKAVKTCEEKGVLYLRYGRFNYGNKSASPLREFKVRNGFEEMLVPRCYVPLTRWGRTCLQCGAHRGLMGVLPEWAISAGVGARARWKRVVVGATE